MTVLQLHVYNFHLLLFFLKSFVFFLPLFSYCNDFMLYNVESCVRHMTTVFVLSPSNQRRLSRDPQRVYKRARRSRSVLFPSSLQRDRSREKIARLFKVRFWQVDCLERKTCHIDNFRTNRVWRPTTSWLLKRLQSSVLQRSA